MKRKRKKLVKVIIISNFLSFFLFSIFFSQSGVWVKGWFSDQRRVLISH